MRLEERGGGEGSEFVYLFSIENFTTDLYVPYIVVIVVEDGLSLLRVHQAHLQL